MGTEGDALLQVEAEESLVEKTTNCRCFRRISETQGGQRSVKISDDLTFDLVKLMGVHASSGQLKKESTSDGVEEGERQKQPIRRLVRNDGKDRFPSRLALLTQVIPLFEWADFLTER